MDTEFDLTNDEVLAQMIAQGQAAQQAAKLSESKVSRTYQQHGSRSSNRERSGTRDMTVSANARAIGTGPDSLDTIRHFDGDLMQVCSRCARTYIFIEDSSDSRKASTYTRALAEDVNHRAYAMLIIHHKDDVDGLKPIKRIKIWENGRKLLEDKQDVSWDNWRKGMETLARIHAQNCRPRKRFE